MSQVEVERFLGRVITDNGFRKKAAGSLVSACFSEGLVLSAQEMTLLGQLDLPKFGKIAELLDDSLRRD